MSAHPGRDRDVSRDGGTSEGTLRLQRPDWIGTDAFGPAWAMYAERGSTDSLELLAEARVIVAARNQVEALPPVAEEALDAPAGDGLLRWPALAADAASVRSPFPVVFVDLDRARLRGHDVTLAGGLVAWPQDGEDFEPLIVPLRWRGLSVEEFGQDRDASLAAGERVVAVLSLLQATNVELVEAGGRKERKRAAKHGRKVPLMVHVRSANRRYAQSDGDGGANYGIRWEVAGHYIRHFETKADGTPNRVFERYARLHPEKVLTLDGRRLVKFWQPPFIKGPADKPLVPKVRTLARRRTP